MDFDFPAPHQVPQPRSLWRQAFGDGEEFLEAFFSLCFSRVCSTLPINSPISFTINSRDI